MKLTETQHAERSYSSSLYPSLDITCLYLRTRLLDGWMKNVLYSHQKMNENQQSAVIIFLGLNRDQQKCIYLRDKLFHGVVEAPRATHEIITREKSMGTLPRTPPNTPRNSEVSEMPKTPSQTYLAASSNGTESYVTSQPPLFQRSLTGPIPDSGPSSAHRKVAYSVKIASSTPVLNRAPSLPLPPPPVTMTSSPNKNTVSREFNENSLMVNEVEDQSLREPTNETEKETIKQQETTEKEAPSQQHLCCVIA